MSLPPSSRQPFSAHSYPAEWTLSGGSRVLCTGWAQGDMSGGGAIVERRRRAVADLPWTVLRQVHGARVVVVEEPGGSSDAEADAAVTSCPGVALAVLSADCAPIAFSSPEGLIGVAHAGWKGLRAGVVEATVQSMRRLGATKVEAVLGPCIHPCCYEFGPDDLHDMAARLGPGVRATSGAGRPALDLPAAVAAAVRLAGATLGGASTLCTGCAGGLWSWRAQSTTRRQATVIWHP